MEILRQENEVQKRLIEAQKQELAKLRVKAFAGAPAATNATSSTGIEVMRKQLVQAQATVCDAQDILASLLPEQTATSRAGSSWACTGAPACVRAKAFRGSSNTSTR